MQSCTQQRQQEILLWFETGPKADTKSSSRLEEDCKSEKKRVDKFSGWSPYPTKLWLYGGQGAQSGFVHSVHLLMLTFLMVRKSWSSYWYGTVWYWVSYWKTSRNPSQKNLVLKTGLVQILGLTKHCLVWYCMMQLLMLTLLMIRKCWQGHGMVQCGTVWYGMVWYSMV